MASFGNRRLRASQYAFCAVLLLIAPIEDARPITAKADYDRAWQLFLHGDLAGSQQEAARGYRRFERSDPASASEFLLLEANALVWRGMYEDALQLLSSQPLVPYTQAKLILKLTTEGSAFTGLQNFPAANQKLAETERLCSGSTYVECGGLPRARGILALGHGQLAEARRYFLTSLSFARIYRDRWLETTALLNLGVVALQNEHYDEAVDWSSAAYRAAVRLGAEDMAQVASGNLGWAYFELGDTEKSLKLLLEAKKRAADLGDVRAEINWLTDAGQVYRDVGDFDRAAESHRQALELARKINSKEDIVTALEDLAYVSIDLGVPNQASAYIDQLTPLLGSSDNRLDALDVLLAQGKIAAARRQDRQAETIFLAVETDPDSQTSMRLTSEHELAKLFELEGNINAAGNMYKKALTTFESARSQLKKEDSKLPFLANARPIYDDYIRFMVKQGNVEEALLVADRSRARTLAQGLGLAASNRSLHQAAFSPQVVARKAGATLLFYWLGEKQSYLWTVTPEKVALFPLAKASEIAPLIERYRSALLSQQDPIEFADKDGLELSRLLIAPAAKLIRPNAPVMILADGALNQLNFETLIIPDQVTETGSKSNISPSMHYWIDDVTLLSVPSMAMLAAAKPAQRVAPNLLLLGNPVSPGDEYPSLPLFGFEMAQVKKHFAANNTSVFVGQKANPAAYLSGNPARFSYIHFVAHAIASRTDPLDSAIILSGSTLSGSTLSGSAPVEDSFKLYARDIMQHPIDAKLVTISACFGSGTRSYAGEGLVGLSWAFLRAGAHNTIGALWEVSDDSTPQLMEKLYQGLQDGKTPAAALRRAKLDLLHSGGKFQTPFYWAPFQLYTRD